MTQGKNGLHSEHLGFLLSEMQAWPRPGATCKRMNAVVPTDAARVGGLGCARSPERSGDPVVTLRELGILRDVRQGADGLEVVITPTSTRRLPGDGPDRDDVRSALQAAGLQARVITSWRRPGPPTG